MNIHKNARLTPHSRAELVRRVLVEGQSKTKVAAAFGVCLKTASKWLARFTRPYTPKTNGKAERFIQTSLREWAYAQVCPNSQHRAAELPIWLQRYNWHRPHGSLKSKPPISRLGLTEDNLLRFHI